MSAFPLSLSTGGPRANQQWQTDRQPKVGSQQPELDFPPFTLPLTRTLANLRGGFPKKLQTRVRAGARALVSWSRIRT
jgi:hypothetical protein